MDGAGRHSLPVRRGARVKVARGQPGCGPGRGAAAPRAPCGTGRPAAVRIKIEPRNRQSALARPGRRADRRPVGRSGAGGASAAGGADAVGSDAPAAPAGSADVGLVAASVEGRAAAASAASPVSGGREADPRAGIPAAGRTTAAHVERPDGASGRRRDPARPAASVGRPDSGHVAGRRPGQPGRRTTAGRHGTATVIPRPRQRRNDARHRPPYARNRRALHRGVQAQPRPPCRGHLGGRHRRPSAAGRLPAGRRGRGPQAAAGHAAHDGAGQTEIRDGADRDLSLQPRRQAHPHAAVRRPRSVRRRRRSAGVARPGPVFCG